MLIDRLLKYGEEVYIFAQFENGLPHILKGKVIGILKSDGIYKFVYQIETSETIYFRFADGIYKSVAEIEEDVKNLVVD